MFTRELLPRNRPVVQALDADNFIQNTRKKIGRTSLKLFIKFGQSYFKCKLLFLMSSLLPVSYFFLSAPEELKEK
jgi:hypothetical protein